MSSPVERGRYLLETIEDVLCLREDPSADFDREGACAQMDATTRNEFRASNNSLNSCEEYRG
jgi:hypothetical protein